MTIGLIEATKTINQALLLRPFNELLGFEKNKIREHKIKSSYSP
jgi:hypothetical protein